MKKCWWLPLVILLISGAALADSTAPSITADAVTNHSDLSVSYLSQIFGTVGNVLQGVSGQMLGHILYEFNFGVLAVAGLWIVGTTLMATLRGATEGSFMGQNNKVPFIVLRIVIGIAFLIPSSQTGYSLSQDILGSVLVKGAELGDMVWDQGLNFVANGGQLWIQPVVSGTDESDDAERGQTTTQILTNTSVIGSGAGDGLFGNGTQAAVSPYLGLAQRIFASEVCMVSSSIFKQQSVLTSTSSVNGVVTSAGGNTTASFDWYEDDTVNALFFPGGSDDPSIHSYDPNNPNSGYGCGYVSWDTIPGALYDPNNNQTCQARAGSNHGSGSNCEYSRLAIVGMANDLSTAANKYACQNYSGGSNPDVAACSGANGENSTEVNQDVINAFYMAIVNYANTITPLANYLTQQQATAAGNNSETFIPTAEQEGWLTAGRFYWDLIHMETANARQFDLNDFTPADNTLNTTFVVTYPGQSALAAGIQSPMETMGHTPGLHGSYDTEAVKDYPTVNNTVFTFLSDISGTPSPDYYNGVMAQLSSAGQAANDPGQATNTGPYNPNSGDSGVINMVDNSAFPLITDCQNLIKTFSSQNVGYDPIMFLYNIGAECLSIAGDIWFAPVSSMLGIALTLAVCTSEYDGLGGVAQVVDWVKPFFIMLAGAMSLVGFVLAVFIPLYPYIIWLFTIVGAWFIPAIEMMVAMPIIALGIMNSQGHDIWGRAEQAINQILLLFLRPALMVIGLIAGMILSFVCLSMAETGFSGIAYDLFSNGFSGYLGPDDVERAAAHAANHALGGTDGNLGTLAGTATPGSSIGNTPSMLKANSTYLTSLLLLPAYLLTFAYVMFQIIKKCYEVTVLTGNAISHIGGRSDSHAVEQMASSTENAVSSGGGKITQQVGGGLSGTVKPIKAGGGDGAAGLEAGLGA